MASSTTASPLAGSLEMPPWKNLVSHAAALVVAFLFICAGVYKAIDPYKFANLAKNLLVPYDLTLPLALLLAVAETTAGVLILVPRFRRWGAMLAGAAAAGLHDLHRMELQGSDRPRLQLLPGADAALRDQHRYAPFGGTGLLLRRFRLPGRRRDRRNLGQAFAGAAHGRRDPGRGRGVHRGQLTARPTAS